MVNKNNIKLLLYTTLFNLFSNGYAFKLMTSSWTNINENCLFDEEGYVRFFAVDGFRKCDSDSCPLDAPSPYYGVECKECCAHQNRRQNTDTTVGDDDELTKENIVIIILCIVIFMMTIIIIVMYISHRRITTISNCLSPTSGSLPNEASLVDDHGNFKGKQKLIPHLAKTKLITEDSTETLTGNVFDITLIKRAKIPDSMVKTTDDGKTNVTQQKTVLLDNDTDL